MVMQNKELKDGSGSFADDQNAPVIKACKYIRTHFPDVLVMTDLCLCGYTDHGHCGIIREKEIVFSKTDSTKGEGPCEYEIDNAKSIDRLATIAVAFAKAGAQVSIFVAMSLPCIILHPSIRRTSSLHF